LETLKSRVRYEPMQKRRLGKSDIFIAPLAFGGNVFGWTADETTSFRLLDAFVDAGFNLIDTADVYSAWAPGNSGGESETIIGNWLKKNHRRHQIVIATKVGMEIGPGKKGLKKNYILQAVEDSLRRLQTDTIDLYQSHIDDLDTPIEETLEAFTLLIKQGKIRAIGASQIDPIRLKKSLEISQNLGLASYTCLQPRYNLYDRKDFETNLAPLCQEYGLGVINFYSLAAGFLTGKYRKEEDLVKSVRGTARVKESYFNKKGHRIIQALDLVSKSLDAPVASVAVSWILSNPIITAPIASATNLEQLSALIRAPQIKLGNESIDLLNRASLY
jgi:aryl-alcohol dehydrogenase-like predicted oxidoreductase